MPAWGPGAQIKRVTISCPSGVVMSTAMLRLPLLSPAQNRLRPFSVTGHRSFSRPPRIRSKRMTSAPICASVMPASGAATNAAPSTIRSPSRILTMQSLPWACCCSVREACPLCPHWTLLTGPMACFGNHVAHASDACMPIAPSALAVKRSSPPSGRSAPLTLTRSKSNKGRMPRKVKLVGRRSG